MRSGTRQWLDALRGAGQENEGWPGMLPASLAAAWGRFGATPEFLALARAGRGGGCARSTLAAGQRRWNSPAPTPSS